LISTLALRLFFGGILSKIMAFLRSLNGQGVIGLIVSVALTFLLVRAEGEARHQRKQAARFEALYRADHATLQGITTAKNDQAAATKDRIVTVTRIVHDAEGRAKVVESAPLLGSCKTPPAIMGADL
jgi:hypothetical protein